MSLFMRQINIPIMVMIIITYLKHSNKIVTMVRIPILHITDRQTDRQVSSVVSNLLSGM